MTRPSPSPAPDGAKAFTWRPMDHSRRACRRDSITMPTGRRTTPKRRRHRRHRPESMRGFRPEFEPPTKLREPQERRSRPWPTTELLRMPQLLQLLMLPHSACQPRPLSQPSVRGRRPGFHAVWVPEHGSRRAISSCRAGTSTPQAFLQPRRTSADRPWSTSAPAPATSRHLPPAPARPARLRPRSGPAGTAAASHAPGGGATAPMPRISAVARRRTPPLHAAPSAASSLRTVPSSWSLRGEQPGLKKPRRHLPWTRTASPALSSGGGGAGGGRRGP